MTSSDGDGGAASFWNYIVDFGCNFQGGLNISFGTPTWAAGRVVRVRTGETLWPNGSVAYYVTRTKTKGKHVEVDVLNNWTAKWVLRGAADPGAGTGLKRQRVETHEYVVMRYAEIVGAPEPPSAESVRGWAVQYPFDGMTAERAGAPIDAECTAHHAEGAATVAAAATPAPAAPAVQSPAAAAPLTSFRSSSPTLDAVWHLCRYTVLVGALDSNTDSNTRQRDLCNLDAMLASRCKKTDDVL